jgi:hypothetical protein
LLACCLVALGIQQITNIWLPCCFEHPSTHLQALCRAEVQARPCPQLVLACCTALVSGGAITTQAIFKHTPPQELVDRLAASAAGGAQACAHDCGIQQQAVMGGSETGELQAM